MSVSTTFYPSANLLSSNADLVFVSSDSVFFYVHMSQILRESSNSFKSLVPDPHSLSAEDKSGVGPIVPLSDPSPVLNIVLHTIYNMSFVHYSPANSTLVSAVDALHKYGISLRVHLTPSTLLYQYLLAQAPSSPFEFYATAGHYDLYELAAAVSPYTLAVPLSDLSDELVDRMGSIYLKRIFFLHLGRVDALKRLLLPPPEGHSPSSDCDYVEQKKLTRAWALASAYLAWDVRPGKQAFLSPMQSLTEYADLSTTAIELALLPLGDHISCEACKHAFRERVKQLLIEWALVKVRATSCLLGLDRETDKLTFREPYDMYQTLFPLSATHTNALTIIPPAFHLAYPESIALVSLSRRQSSSAYCISKRVYLITRDGIASHFC